MRVVTRIVLTHPSVVSGIARFGMKADLVYLVLEPQNPCDLPSAPKLCPRTVRRWLNADRVAVAAIEFSFPVYGTRTKVASHLHSTASSSEWTPLSRAARAGVSDCTGFAPNETQPRLALTTLSLTPCHPPSASVPSLSPVRLVFFAALGEEKNKPTPAEKGKNMKLDEVNLKTKEAVEYLVQSLESGQSAVLTQYLGAMAKFRNYSFGNIMLIARQKPDATNVAGLRTWNSLGRFVRRGEKGIFILAPLAGC